MRIGVLVFFFFKLIESKVLPNKLIDDSKTQVVTQFERIPRNVWIFRTKSISFIQNGYSAEIWLLTEVNEEERQIYRHCDLRLRLSDEPSKTCVYNPSSFAKHGGTITAFETASGLVVLQQFINGTRMLLRSDWNSSSLLVVSEALLETKIPLVSVALKSDQRAYLYQKSRYGLEVSVGKFKSNKMTFRPVSFFGKKKNDSVIITAATVNPWNDVLIGLFALENTTPDKNRSLAFAASCDGLIFSELLPLLNHRSGLDRPADGLLQEGSRIYFYVHHYHSNKNSSILVRYLFRLHALNAYLDQALMGLPGCQRPNLTIDKTSTMNISSFTSHPTSSRTKKSTPSTSLQSICIRLLITFIIEGAIVAFCLYGLQDNPHIQQHTLDSAAAPLAQESPPAAEKSHDSYFASDAVQELYLPSAFKEEEEDFKEIPSLYHRSLHHHHHRRP